MFYQSYIFLPTLHMQGDHDRCIDARKLRDDVHDDVHVSSIHIHDDVP